MEGWSDFAAAELLGTPLGCVVGWPRGEAATVDATNFCATASEGFRRLFRRKLGIRGRFTNLFRKEKGGERREGRERGRRRREEKEEDKMNFGRVSRFCVWK